MLLLYFDFMTTMADHSLYKTGCQKTTSQFTRPQLFAANIYTFLNKKQ